MKLEKIQSLIHMLEASSLTALEVSSGSDRVRLERNAVRMERPASEGNGPLPLPTPVLDPSPVPAAPKAQPETPATAPAEGKIEVKSPMVGVFYAAPSPDSEPFVTVGSRVKKGDVVCIIEAMKLMNEITAEADGEITEICAENGAIVEYSQVLFRMK